MFHEEGGLVGEYPADQRGVVDGEVIRRVVPRHAVRRPLGTPYLSRFRMGGNVRARFTVDEIATVALGIVDEAGLGALSMRTLAAALGTGPMTVYN
ncbi:MAG: transcriptional regulator, tetR family [Mycobacterium sp.]|nr:transcriptional regulator, tetR family [Mycobacterium sp.]